MKTAPFLILCLLACFPSKAEISHVRELIQEGKPAEALAALAEAKEEDDAAIHYWKGRALTDLGRMSQAVGHFHQVPPESVFYPYAAKGLLFCAWQSPEVNFVEQVAPLTASKNQEIATLALASLAEYQLRNTTRGDTTTLEDLRKLAKKDPSLDPIIQLLDIEALRRKHQYDEAIAACLSIEANKKLPLVMRQRARLALSEIYYDKEASGNQAGEENGEWAESDEGKGEETLLQFISSNPDSPLLEEAFRRLETHQAFPKSEYAIQKLKEWSEDPLKPRRAALALAVRQRLQLAMGDAAGEEGSFANTAAAILPNEPLSSFIISEHVRYLLSADKSEAATLYLNMLGEEADQARKLFYEASSLKPTDPRAAELFLQCVEMAPPDLRSAALCNAMHCAVLSGDQETEESLLQRHWSPDLRRDLLITHAGLILHSNPPQARAEIESAQQLTPLSTEKGSPRPGDDDSLLLQALLDLQEQPALVLENLQAYPAEKLEGWTDEKILLYYSLQLQAADRMTAKGTPPPHSPEDLLRSFLPKAKSKDIRYTLALHLANRLDHQEKHKEAQELLENLARGLTTGEKKARALLLAGREALHLGSLQGYKKAISLFKDCAEIPSPYFHRAQILQAGAMAWINRSEEAEVLLNNLLQKADTLSATDHALALSAQADDFSLLGTPEGHLKAIETNEKIQKIEGLPVAWKRRSALQHAALCSRAGLHEQALADYLDIINTKPASGPSPRKAEWYILYYAGAGAVYQYLKLERFEEAALMAEKLAEWPEAGRPNGPKSTHFAQWGALIRQTHFLPHARSGQKLNATHTTQPGGR